MTWQTDKIANGYLPTYLKIIQELALGTMARVLELGVDQGHSLQMWRDLLPHGEVVGVDHRPEAMEAVMRLGIVASVILSEQDAPDLPERIQRATDLDEFDLIVDDASHLGKQTATALFNLWPLLAGGGFYVIEDWGVGFPKGAPMYDPEMLRLAESLVGQFNPHRPDPEEWALDNLIQVTFLPGLIILKKGT